MTDDDAMNASDTERSWSRSLAWLLAIAFLVATVITMLLNLNITASEPVFGQGDEVFVDNILIDLANQQERWPHDLAANLLFAIGFAAVAGLGATLPRLLGADDGRARLMAAAFVVAGTLGVVGELVYIGVAEAGINAQYCECALRDAQLISRGEGLNLVANAVGWLTDGFAVVFGVGLFAAAGLARGGSVMTSGWTTYTRWMGVAAVAFVLIGHLLTFLSSAENDLSVAGIALVAIVAGVLTPIWGIWTARSLA